MRMPEREREREREREMCCRWRETNDKRREKKRIK